MNFVDFLARCPPAHHCFALLDGAAHPASTQRLLSRAGPNAQPIFDGVAAESLRDAGAFLLLLEEPLAGGEWFDEAQALDRNGPCLTLLSSPLSASALASHLRQFLTADIGDGIRVVLRFYDPRVLPAALQAWPVGAASCLLAPIGQWHYRGHHEAWQTIAGQGQAQAAKLAEPIVLDAAAQERLMAHSELDHLLFALEPGDDLAADTPYLMRYRKLEPAYLALQQRGVSDTTELLRLLAFGRARGIGNWMSPEWTEHFDHWRTGSSTFDDLVVRLAAARERSAR